VLVSSVAGQTIVLVLAKHPGNHHSLSSEHVSSLKIPTGNMYQPLSPELVESAHVDGSLRAHHG
jgi:hypothetical protein